MTTLPKLTIQQKKEGAMEEISRPIDRKNKDDGRRELPVRNGENTVGKVGKRERTRDRERED